jgi:murein DD-endopeptidase MepM/ murein hydrolase activator NlpD
VAIHPFPIVLPNELNPGGVLLVNLQLAHSQQPLRLPFSAAFASQTEIKNLTLNKTELTVWKKNMWMGSVGIPRITGRPNIATPAPRPVVTLVGQAPIQNGHAFRHPKQIIYLHDIRVKLKTLEQPVKIRLPASVQERLKKDENLLQAEREEMRTVLAKREREWTLDCWQKPLNSRKVSDFASPRTLPDGRQYYHSGMDLRAATGTPIMAAGSGIIAYSGMMTVPGETIVIDHGGGIFSRYLHLEKRNLETGKTIARGKKIGLSGATGRVEAPHLHWEVVWKGIPVDPENFLQAVAQTCDPA